MTIPANVRKGEGRLHYFWLEVDLKWCANTYGTGLCTATGAAGSECVNCRKGCQDPANFVEAIKTIRLIPKDRVGVLLDFEGYPFLIKAEVGNATEMAMGDGLSSRERLDILIADAIQHDRDMDPYWQNRATPAVGTWLGRLRARHEYYIGYDIRYYDGYIVNGLIDMANFEMRTYLLDEFNRPSGGQATMRARDDLMLGDERKAKGPVASNGELTADITAVALSLQVTSGEGKNYIIEENLFVHSDDLTDAAWTKSGVVVTANAGNDIHGNTVADQVADDSAAAAESISQAASDYTVTEPYCVAIDIEKDAIGRATRFPVLRIEHAGSTTETSDIALDTSTGETDITTSTGAIGGAVDYGTHWRLWIMATSNDGSNTSCTGYLLPSAGASATWVQGVAATGSVFASRPQIERNLQPWDYIETAASSVKNGTLFLCGDEVIHATLRAGDVLSWPDTTYRGQCDTTAAAHSAGDNVQWCLDVRGLNMARAIQRELIFFTKLVPARIPFIDWEVERVGKMAPWTIDGLGGVITKPEGVLDIIADQCACSLTNVWMDTVARSVRLNSMAPKPIDADLNEEDQIINKHADIKDQPDKRISEVVINYGLWNVLKPFESTSYNKTLTKPGNQNYGLDSIETFYCRWFNTQSAASALASRMAIMRGEMPIRAFFDLDDKDGSYDVGSAVTISVDALPDVITGAASPRELIIISKKPIRGKGGIGRNFAIVAEPNPYPGYYGRIAPNSGMSANWSVGTDYEKKKYMAIGYNNGINFPDGSPPKQIT